MIYLMNLPHSAVLPLPMVSQIWQKHEYHWLAQLLLYVVQNYGVRTNRHITHLCWYCNCWHCKFCAYIQRLTFQGRTIWKMRRWFSGTFRQRQVEMMFIRVSTLYVQIVLVFYSKYGWVLKNWKLWVYVLGLIMPDLLPCLKNIFFPEL